MPIQNEKFSFIVSDSSGNALTGALVELRKDATIYTTTEVGNGWYSIASIPTGKYSVFVDSVDTGETKAVGSGQVAALGNETDNVPVSTSTEYGFQDSTALKTTLSLDNVTNVAVPDPTASDANKVIQVDSNGDYELNSINVSGFQTIFEVQSTSDFIEALAAEFDSKLLVITREDFNFINSQTFEVWGSCSIIVAYTFQAFQFLNANGETITFNYKTGADIADTGVMFLNGVIRFSPVTNFVINLPFKVTNLSFNGTSFIDITGTGNLIYENLQTALPSGVTITTTQDWWQNSAGGSGGSQDLDSVLQQGNTSDLAINLDAGDQSTLTEFLKFRLLDGNGEVKMRYENTLSSYQFRFGGSVFRDLYISNATTDTFIIRSGTVDESFIAPLKATFQDVIATQSTTNGTPSSGDIWNNGTETEIENPLKVNGDGVFKDDGATTTLLVGDETASTASGQNGIRLMANTNGSVYLDHKTQLASDSIFYRCGTNTEQGNARTFMEVDASTGEITLPNIPTGTQAGLLAYDAQGRIIQGSGGGGGVTPGAWTNATLATNIGVRSGYRPLRYRSDGIDGVQVEGTCKYNTGFSLSPGFTVVLFTLPSGSRPNNDFNVNVQVGFNGSTPDLKAWAHVDASTGQVTLKNSDAVAISELYDISFNFRFSLT